MKNPLDATIQYLNSDEALKSVEADPYWPKWNSPWWHMHLLWEMGESRQIPARLVASYVDRFQKYPLKTFPFFPGPHMPEGTENGRLILCHCQLGTFYQVMYACGVNVDRDIPWIRDWFFKYQMQDGGYSCDNSAYLVKNECPSSMVGTISVFEALLYTRDTWSVDERLALDKMAQFMIDRRLTLGSSTAHNADERISALDWPKLTFPRFYFYDVLRGLEALLVWSKKTGSILPRESYQHVVDYMKKEFSTGEVTIGRKAIGDWPTRVQMPSGEWVKNQPAAVFPLFEALSQVDETSPYLSKRWQNCLELLRNTPA